MTDKASDIRASSPPDATLASDLGLVPACPATRNSTVSLPLEPGGQADKLTLQLPPCMARSCMAAVTCCEIGSASCRERVCQYVLLSVVVVSFNTTKPARYLLCK